jgi:hypothetical protein
VNNKPDGVGVQHGYDGGRVRQGRAPRIAVSFDFTQRGDSVMNRPHASTVKLAVRCAAFGGLAAALARPLSLDPSTFARLDADGPFSIRTLQGLPMSW